jgi:hypothetical protein
MLIFCAGTRRHHRNTNSRKLRGRSGLGDCRVLFRSHRFGVLAALAVAAALGGCADFSSGQAWFAKPFDVSGRGAGYSFSELAETKKGRPSITANDLVNANGSCPAPATPVSAAPPPAPASAAGAATGSAPSAAAPAGDASSVLGSGIALGMSECEVVNRSGQPSSVQIGSLPNGDRTATLTFEGGPRSGIYHFVRGALTEMDAVAAPPAPPQVAKKKPVKQKRSAQN